MDLHYTSVSFCSKYRKYDLNSPKNLTIFACFIFDVSPLSTCSAPYCLMPMLNTLTLIGINCLSLATNYSIYLIPPAYS